MLAKGEGAVHCRHDVQPGKPLEDFLLAAQSGYRIRTVHIEPSVRPGLLEHDLRTGLKVVARVEATPVGEVQRPLDPVRQAVYVHAVPRCQVRLEKPRQSHPFGEPEARAPPVGHQSPFRVLNRQFPRASLRQAVPLDKTPIARTAVPCPTASH